MECCRRVVVLPFFLMMLILGGCASVSVTDIGTYPVQPSMPKEILVEDFDVPTAVLRVDRSGESLEKFRAELAGSLARNIALRVDKGIAPARVVTRGTVDAGRPAWLVTGRFVRVNQGSRALRMIVGLGAGGSKLETRVVVYDLSTGKPRPILTFETTGGSNATAGAIFNLNYWFAGAAALSLSMSGLSFDTVRTSREVTAMLSEYMAEQGLIEPKRSKRPKKLGEWP